MRACKGAHGVRCVDEVEERSFACALAKMPAGPLRRATVAVSASLRLPCGQGQRPWPSPGTNSPQDCSCPGSVHRARGPSHNSLRSLRSLRSDKCAESVNEARCARGHEPCASRRLSGAPRRPARPRLCGGIGCSRSNTNHRFSAAGGIRWGRFVGRRGAQARGRRAQRASLSDSAHLSERSERSERSELCDATPGRAPQCSRSEAETAPP